MNVPKRRGKRWAMFADDVLKEDIYDVTTAPKRFFKNKKDAKKFVKKMFGTMEGIKLYKY